MAFPAGWTRQCSLTIQHSQVPADQTAFPVLITQSCLPAEMVTLGGANAAQSDGGDIRFSSDSAGASQLACEVVVWIQNATPANAVAEIYVPVNVLTATDVTIYVWYKVVGGGLSQPAASSTYGSQAVWDANYQAVWHFGDGTTLSVADSTSNANNGTNHGATATAGLAGGGAANFVSASSQYIDVGTPASLDIHGSPVTVEAVVKVPSPLPGSGVFPIVVGKGYPHAGGFDLLLHDNTGLDANSFYFQATNASLVVPATLAIGPAVINTIYELFATYDNSSTASMYINASRISHNTDATWGANGIPSSSTQKLSIGSGTDETAFFWNGVIDEVRISNSCRSSTWVTTQYHNQSAPSSFVVPGTPAAVTTGIIGAGIGTGTIAFSARPLFFLHGDGVGTGLILRPVFEGDGISSNIINIAATPPVKFQADGVGTGVWLGELQSVTGPGILPASGRQIWNFGY